MRVRVEITQNIINEGSYINYYEAQSILFTQTQETFSDELQQVPALIVLLDSGEYRVQPLVIQNGTVKVFAVKPKPSWWKRMIGNLK